MLQWSSLRECGPPGVNGLYQQAMILICERFEDVGECHDAIHDLFGNFSHIVAALFHNHTTMVIIYFYYLYLY